MQPAQHMRQCAPAPTQQTASTPLISHSLLQAQPRTDLELISECYPGKCLREEGGGLLHVHTSTHNKSGIAYQDKS
jgi:hypothetical protein